MSRYCVIDLHSTNNVPAIIDGDGRILFQKRLPNDLSTVISALESFKRHIYAPYLGITTISPAPTLASMPIKHGHP